MKYLSEDINSRIISIVKQNFDVTLVNNVERFIEFFNTLIDYREAFPDFDENAMILNTENARKICDTINGQIDIHFQKEENLEFEIVFPELVNQINDLLSPLEPSIKVEQSEARFKLLNTDKKFTGLVKRIKILIFKSQQLVIKLINNILKIGKRKPIESKYWAQNIPLKNVAFTHLRNKLLKKLSLIYEDIFKLLSEKSILFWNYDESFNMSS